MRANNKPLENLLLNFIDNQTLPHYIDALADVDKRIVTGVMRLLGLSQRFDANRLITLFEDPDIPNNVLVQILIQHRESERYLPHNARTSDKEGDAGTKPWPGRTKPAARGCGQYCDECGKAEDEHTEFREQSDAAGDSERDPPTMVVGLAELQQTEETNGPAQLLDHNWLK